MDLKTKYQMNKMNTVIEDLQEQVHEVREAVIKMNQLVTSLLDEKKGIEATVQRTVDRMFNEQLEIEIPYEVTRAALEGLALGGIVEE